MRSYMKINGKLLLVGWRYRSHYGFHKGGNPSLHHFQGLAKFCTLLNLNHERYDEELAQGLHEKEKQTEFFKKK